MQIKLNGTFILQILSRRRSQAHDIFPRFRETGARMR